MLVVGFGNTAADVACELAGKAETVYLSHRHGSIVVSKATNLRFLVTTVLVAHIACSFLDGLITNPSITFEHIARACSSSNCLAMPRTSGQSS
jgi:cation diffusion facilitator CzcD-associated flavoprotein CzcO